MTELRTEERIVKPRLRTTIGASVLSMASRLPDEVLEEHVLRFSLLAVVGAGLWMLALLMHTIFIIRGAHGSIPVWLPAIDVGGIVASATAFGYVRYTDRSVQAKIHAGLCYMLWNAAAVSVFNTTRLPAIQPDQLSWSTVVILISSMTIPATPATMFLASAAAASMDPLAVAIAHLFGVPVTSLGNMLLAFLPNHACAVVAIVPSHALIRSDGA